MHGHALRKLGDNGTPKRDSRCVPLRDAHGRKPGVPKPPVRAELNRRKHGTDIVNVKLEQVRQELRISLRRHVQASFFRARHINSSGQLGSLRHTQRSADKSPEQAPQFINENIGPGSQSGGSAGVSKTEGSIERDDAVVTTGYPKSELGLTCEAQEVEALLNE